MGRGGPRVPNPKSHGGGVTIGAMEGMGQEYMALVMFKIVEPSMECPEQRGDAWPSPRPHGIQHD